jgi:YidC/Oxa1 family membrane protein insertase
MSENSGGKKKELSMEIRLLLAFLLMGLVLFVTPYLYKSANAPAPKGPQNVTPQRAAEVTKPPAPSPAEAGKPETGSTPAAPQQAGKEETFVVDTNLFRVVFSNRGANVRSWVLKKYKDLNGKQLELVNLPALAKTPPPLSFETKEQSLEYLKDRLFVAKPTSDNLGIDYEYSDGQTVARKSFRFLHDSYLVQVTSEVTRNNAPVPHVLAWRGGFGDPTLHNAASAERNVYFVDGRLHTKVAKDAKNGPVAESGPFVFAGIEDTFFAAVFTTKDTANVELVTWSDAVPVPAEDKEEQFVGAGVGTGGGINQLALFVGPKDSDILRKVDPRLGELIDWGRWFGFLAKPLFYALNWTNDRLTHNFGWAIILVTIALNIATMPFRLQSLRSAKKMQALQPEIKRINDKYKGLSIRDPKKAEQNAEMMALYKQHGVNPVGGCVPMLVQIPFFIAYYTVLSVAIELRGAPWLWVSDLSRPEMLPIRILPVLLVVTQFVTQKMTPASPGMDPSQQKMMMIMPLVFGFMFYYASAGLVLYWLTGNLVAIVQQWIINRMMPTPVVETRPVSKTKRRA